MLSVLPRFVVLEMINDMTNVEDEHLQHQFHRIYIHRYENVRWEARHPRPAVVCDVRVPGGSPLTAMASGCPRISPFLHLVGSFVSDYSSGTSKLPK